MYVHAVDRDIYWCFLFRRALFRRGTMRESTWREETKKSTSLHIMREWSSRVSLELVGDVATEVDGSIVSCTARICVRAVRFANFRQRCRYGGARCTQGEDYERVVDPCNVCDNYRIAVSRVAACRRYHERERENDLSQLTNKS